ncbi:hypothetical protein KI387_017764, partial [Taxus chinensis]
TTVIISPTISSLTKKISPPTKVPSIPPSSETPTNILDKSIQHDNVNTDDSKDYDEKFDVVRLIDEALGKPKFTSIDVDDSYFEDTFLSNGP